jgi:hypothetical protein
MLRMKPCQVLRAMGNNRRPLEVIGASATDGMREVIGAPILGLACPDVVLRVDAIRPREQLDVITQPRKPGSSQGQPLPLSHHRHRQPGVGRFEHQRVIIHYIIICDSGFFPLGLLVPRSPARVTLQVSNNMRPSNIVFGLRDRSPNQRSGRLGLYSLY